VSLERARRRTETCRYVTERFVCEECSLNVFTVSVVTESAGAGHPGSSMAYGGRTVNRAVTLQLNRECGLNCEFPK